jgi:hypothetical protein
MKDYSMSQCLRCGFDNYPNAYVCVHCYAILRASDAEQYSSTFSVTFPKPAPVASHLNVDLTKLDKRTLVLYIGELNEPIILRVVQMAFLGRASENVKVHPLLDLTPFDAGSKGVSRVHAAIYRSGTGMAIEDRASSNGTWLNGVRLEPRKFYKLSSGDHLFLSKLAVEVYIGQTELHTLARLDTKDLFTNSLTTPTTPLSNPPAKEEKPSAEVPPDPNDPKPPILPA